MNVKGQWFTGALIVMAAVAVGSAQGATGQAKTAAAKTTAQAKTAAPKPMTFMNARISDSMCGANKHTMAGGDPEKCTAACVKGGSKYVIVDKDNKVHTIANQDSPDLAKHAGHSNLTITGTMKGDDIVVSKIVMPPAKGK